MDLYPKARRIGDVREMRDDDGSCLIIGDVKNPARVREKIKEAAEEHGRDPKMWPLVQLIGDLLRASIVLRDFDTFVAAWLALADGFAIRDGHGRLKVFVVTSLACAVFTSLSPRVRQNNLWLEAERPPGEIAPRGGRACGVDDPLPRMRQTSS